MGFKEQKGAIVVEATISLTAFMFTIVTLLTIINICLVQARVGIAINQAAKDISQYTYIYSMMGLMEKQAGMSAAADPAREAIESVQTMSGAIEKLVGVTKSFATDNEMQESLIELIKNGIVEGVKSEVTGRVVKAVVRERLSSQDMECDEFLKKMGIQDGLDGIRFTDSVVCLNGSQEIKIIAKYQVHVIKLLGIDITFDFSQCAATKAWVAATP